MKDYNVLVKVRNNYLMRAMLAAGYANAAQLAKAAGIHASQVGDFLNLKKSAYNHKGELREPLVKIAGVLNKMPVELFPPQHLEKPLRTNTAEIEEVYDGGQGLVSNVLVRPSIECVAVTSVLAVSLGDDKERGHIPFGWEHDGSWYGVYELRNQ